MYVCVISLGFLKLVFVCENWLIYISLSLYELGYVFDS